MGDREFVLILVAIVAIAILEVVAIMNGVDGVTFSAAMMAIAGLAGYKVKGWKDSRGSKESGGKVNDASDDEKK